MKYVIGLDFGTLSGRAVLASVSDGMIVMEAVKEYPHGVMDSALPDGTALGSSWALQDPEDYLVVMETLIRRVLEESQVDRADVIGIASDFTACTIVPVDRDGVPLCARPQYRSRPHAYVKLWKHHAAQDQADRITGIAKERGEPFLERYGGKISSEWLLPKVLQILEEDPELYEAADQFVEVADWITWRLTGGLKRNSCTAGFKEMWNKKDGFPSEEFLRAVHPGLAGLAKRKLRGEICPAGQRAGELTEEMAERTGLCPGTAVGISIIDAHAGVIGSGITGPGQMMMTMGTSTCHILMSREEHMVPGICGVVEDGVLPGYAAYEAGQACVGDQFDWFVKRCVPAGYMEEARERGLHIHQLLTEKAARLRPGESGLIALDWWNGNRTPLVDYDLKGVLVGMTLATKPEEIYRAFIEATAYGTNWIIENFEAHGVEIRELFACGGISQKNALMMQIYADVTGREIRISESLQTPALGAAMLGAAAAGKARGGYDSVSEAAAGMGRVKEEAFYPFPENTAAYRRLYLEYRELADYFGRGKGRDILRGRAV